MACKKWFGLGISQSKIQNEITRDIIEDALSLINEELFEGFVDDVDPTIQKLCLRYISGSKDTSLQQKVIKCFDEIFSEGISYDNILDVIELLEECNIDELNEKKEFLHSINDERNNSEFRQLDKESQKIFSILYGMAVKKSISAMP